MPCQTSQHPSVAACQRRAGFFCHPLLALRQAPAPPTGLYRALDVASPLELVDDESRNLGPKGARGDAAMPRGTHGGRPKLLYRVRSCEAEEDIMATASLDIAKPNPAAASGGASEAALVDGIEKIAELAPAGRAAGRASIACRPHPRRAYSQARRDRRARARAQDARRPALALDLFPRRGRLRGDDERRQGSARRARRSLHARRARRSCPSRFRRTARANGCCGCRRPARSTRAPRSNASTSPRSTAARSASRARSAAR